jgi:hypothetical protein
MQDPIDWLMEGPPWVQYRTRVDLLDQPEDAQEVVAARQEMLAHPQVQGLIRELQQWPGPTLANHRSASLLIHKLSFAADLGLRADDPSMDDVLSAVMAHQSQEGPFQSLLKIHPRFGGSGQDQWSWMLCDAPLILYALQEFGYRDDPRVRAAMQHLVELIRDNGWPCAAAPELGKFRGPGRKEDPCPYANLVMLKALAGSDHWRDTPASHVGTEATLQLWEERRERHPYLFYMGTDFSKLKAPLIWYDILHLAEVLSQFPWIHKDYRFREILNIIQRKSDPNGRYQAESIWMAWKGWDFGQKRNPSPWITLLVLRLMRRVRPRL